MRLLDLYLIIMQGNLVFIQWLQARGLLKDAMRCTARGCRGVMHLQVRAACQDGYHWVCSRTRCKKTKCLRIGSFFYKIPSVLRGHNVPIVLLGGGYENVNDLHNIGHFKENSHRLL